jgi:type IV pilus assembly protein PilN
MSNINLLPWREAQRARNDKKLLAASLMFWASCGLVGFLALQNINGKLEYQRERNQFMVHENSKLNRKIADITQLQAEKQNLVGRIDVIQNLQQDRIHIVHVFDDIVRKLPSGVTLDKMSKKAREIHLKGRAQSNSRVSELMNQANSSQFFGRSNLNVVALKNSSGAILREFDVVLTEAHKQNGTGNGAAPGVQN